MAADLTNEPLANLCRGDGCQVPLSRCLVDGGDLVRDDVERAGCCEDCRYHGRPDAHAADPQAVDVLRLHLLGLQDA